MQVSAFAKIMEHGIMVDQFEEEKTAKLSASGLEN